jgi:hypothetical protein
MENLGGLPDRQFDKWLHASRRNIDAAAGEILAEFASALVMEYPQT